MFLDDTSFAGDEYLLGTTRSIDVSNTGNHIWLWTWELD